MSRRVILLLFGILAFPAPGYAAVSETTTLYFNQYYEQEITTGEDGTEELTETKHYHAGSRIAQRQKGSGEEEGELIFFHQDRLASTRLITSARGEPLATLDYYPYGAIHQYNSVPLTTVGVAEAPTDRQYTSQIYDPSADLYFYNARYYNPTTASFISADTAEGPNRYSYVGGNPINRNDPSGRQAQVAWTPLPLVGGGDQPPKPTPTFPFIEVSGRRAQVHEPKLSYAKATGESGLTGTLIQVGKAIIGRSQNIALSDEDTYLKTAIGGLWEQYGPSPSLEQIEAYLQNLPQRTTYEGKEDEYYTTGYVPLGERFRQGEEQVMCYEKAIITSLVLALSGYETQIVPGRVRYTPVGDHLALPLILKGPPTRPTSSIPVAEGAHTWTTFRLGDEDWVMDATLTGVGIMPYEQYRQERIAGEYHRTTVFSPTREPR